MALSMGAGAGAGSDASCDADGVHDGCIEQEEGNYGRLRAELIENRKALQGLQEEIPQRIVSKQRLSQMRLVMKHQQAATDALRFKQQARRGTDSCLVHTPSTGTARAALRRRVKATAARELIGAER